MKKITKNNLNNLKKFDIKDIIRCAVNNYIEDITTIKIYIDMNHGNCTVPLCTEEEQEFNEISYLKFAYELDVNYAANNGLKNELQVYKHLLRNKEQVLETVLENLNKNNQ